MADVTVVCKGVKNQTMEFDVLSSDRAKLLFPAVRPAIERAVAEMGRIVDGYEIPYSPYPVDEEGKEIIAEGGAFTPELLKRVKGYCLTVHVYIK